MSDTSQKIRWSKRRFLQVAGVVAVAVGVPMMGVWPLAHSRSVLTLGVVLTAVGATWLVCSPFTSNEPMRTPQRRYLREFLPAMLAYFVILLAVMPMLKHVHAAPLKALLVLLPVVPIAFVMRAMLRLLLRSDELEQKLQLEAISIAAMLVTLLSFAAAFLQTVDLLPIDNPLMLVLPAMFGTYGVALAWVKRKYRGE